MMRSRARTLMVVASLICGGLFAIRLAASEEQPSATPAGQMATAPALGALGAAAEGVQPVFITVDPERDTKVLGEYIAAFHPSFVGLTGSPEEIRRVANSYKAFYAKVPDQRSGD